MIDIYAPIIPWVGLGSIKLYESIKNLKELLDQDEIQYVLYGRYMIRYEIKDKIYLFFNLLNGKLFKITALKNYKGLLLNKIKIGMTSKDLLIIEPSFEYEDFEEVYVSKKGIYIETNPETDKIEWISVFIKELETSEFMLAEW